MSATHVRAKSAFRMLGTMPIKNNSSLLKIGATPIFTLIEMVTVLAISAILLSISLPAFTRLVKGQGADLAARNISGTLKACRAHAVSNRQYVALVMPQIYANGGTAAYPATGSLPTSSNYYNSSYRACIVQKVGLYYEFVSWISGEKWEFTPTGVMILRTDSSSTPPVLSDIANATNYTGTVSLIYPPAAAAISPSSGGVSFSDIGGSTNVQNVPAIIFKPNGVPEGTTRYIFIGEGVCTGTALTVTNPDAKAYVALTVDQYTGRVSYGIQ